jgi:hypothetical protein
MFRSLSTSSRGSKGLGTKSSTPIFKTFHAMLGFSARGYTRRAEGECLVLATKRRAGSAQILEGIAL